MIPEKQHHPHPFSSIFTLLRIALTSKTTKMGHLCKHILLALLGTAVHAFPGGLGGPGGGGRAGKGGSGGGPGHGAKSHGGGHSSGPSHSGPDWGHFLDLDKSHPECPPDFPEVLFYDNFANYEPGSQPSTDKWHYDLGHHYMDGVPEIENWGTGEIQSYTKDIENIAITNEGTLRITPIKDSTELYYLDQWTSARIETTEEWDFRAKPGQKVRIQATIKLGDEDPEKQLGIWPAFWSLGSAYRGVYTNWPGVGEIDILESVNGLPSAWQVLHCGWWVGQDGGPCDEPDGKADSAPFTRGVWHVISVDIDRTHPGDNWKDEEIVWRIDGDIVFTVTGAVVGDEESWLDITNKDHMLLLNVAVGGSFPNKEAGFDTPTDETVGGEKSSMWVKYVIVYTSS
ncbi:Concanavalin A-like lectin/glucanase domain containing protein [Rhypophila decipiens]